MRRRAVDAQVTHGERAHVGGPLDAECPHTARKCRRVAHHEIIVCVGDEQRVVIRALQNFGLGFGNGVDGPEELQMRRADVGPDAHLWLGDLHESADLAGMVHPQFEHPDVRLRPQLQQRQRKPNVIVQIAPVAKHL